MTIQDYAQLPKVWGTDRLNIPALDRLRDAQLADLYREVCEFWSYALPEQKPRLDILERNITIMIRNRWLKSVK
jgi:hypothetical protein